MIRPPTILIVEPTCIVSDVLVQVVAKYTPDAVAIVARTVQDACARLDAAPVTVIITDDRFTDGTSIEVLAAARRHAVPAVVIADFHEREAVVRTAGARAFLIKPFDIATLLAALRSVL
jgi:DNA-binding NarL/FixJ family response regulator